MLSNVCMPEKLIVYSGIETAGVRWQAAVWYSNLYWGASEIQSYVQETGRAGRDGLQPMTLLLRKPKFA